jgi:hypothetical protein
VGRGGGGGGGVGPGLSRDHGCGGGGGGGGGGGSWDAVALGARGGKQARNRSGSAADPSRASSPPRPRLTAPHRRGGGGFLSARRPARRRRVVRRVRFAAHSAEMPASLGRSAVEMNRCANSRRGPAGGDTRMELARNSPPARLHAPFATAPASDRRAAGPTPCLASPRATGRIRVTGCSDAEHCRPVPSRIAPGSESVRLGTK